MRSIHLYISYNITNTTSTFSIGNILANIEIDGPHHNQQHRQYFISLPYHYFQHHYGFPVLRQDVSCGWKRRDEVRDDVRGIRKDNRLGDDRSMDGFIDS